ncbi:HpcH/HpaI aldolase/citrate lyase family protein [Hydrogenophaga sp.]|uniref:HpcH/HpaI aldolase/citrate lyase family protein n=1 Tax=Hydrogenophaga sp. TaxID=1904254 RepID=UPI003F709D8D
MENSATSARTFLFLPADRLERLAKALACGAHMVVLDLEDAVAPAAKAQARAALDGHWQQLDEATRARIAIRINAASSPWHADDVAWLSRQMPAGPGAVMLAKTESGAQLDALALQTGDTALLALVESAEGLAALDTIARAPAVTRLVFGHLDFQGDLGMQCDAEERELDAVRLAFVSASRRAGLPGPVDGVTVDLHDPDRLAQDAQRSRRFGFTGKLCIHPSQVDPVNVALGPTSAQVDWARRVLAAASAQRAGAFQFEGAMVDAPVLARARSYLQVAS